MRLTVVRDAALAEGWRDALEAAGIEAVVELDDAALALPGRSPLVGIGAPPLAFVYPISVPLVDRDRAAAVLIDAGWNGAVEGDRRAAPASTGGALRGALWALLAAAAVIAWRVATS
ncbi:MAG: hypothetical protein AMXMBFR23_22500 [Chloroflexota bacterium]